MLKLEIIGNLGADAEKKIVNGFSFVAMNIAHSERVTDKASGEITEATTWVSTTISWNCDAILPYLKKGTKVFVRGFARLKVYTGHDGQKHAGINLSALEVELCALKPSPDETKENQEDKPFE